MASNQEEFGSGGSCVIHESGGDRGGAVKAQQIELTLPASSGEAVDGSLRRTHFPALKDAKENSGASSAATAGSVRARIPSSSMKTKPGSRVLQQTGKAYSQSPRFITTPSPSGSVSLLGVHATESGFVALCSSSYRKGDEVFKKWAVSSNPLPSCCLLSCDVC